MDAACAISIQGALGEVIRTDFPRFVRARSQASLDERRDEMRRVTSLVLAIGMIVLCDKEEVVAQPTPGCVARAPDPAEQSELSTTRSESGPTAQGSPYRHVRGAEAWIDALVAKGIAESPTFKCLVATLDQSDVIVHIQRILARGGGIHRGGLRGLLSHQIRTHGNHRYLRIGVTWQGNEPRLIGTLAHELQHAIEVARVPEVRTRENVDKLFARLSGRMSCDGDCAETIEALDVQRAVIAELTQTAKNRRISNDRPPKSGGQEVNGSQEPSGESRDCRR
jgi:hypothetical protein